MVSRVDQGGSTSKRRRVVDEVVRLGNLDCNGSSLEGNSAAVQEYLAEYWENLVGVNASVDNSASLASRLGGDSDGVSRCFKTGVPYSVRRNPTLIFPPGCPIVLPEVPSCHHCKARRFFLEPEGFCCCAGDILLKPVVLPSDIVELLTGSSEMCKHFRTYIRVYNGNFAYTSMGVKYDTKLASQKECGIYTFRVNGQIHHFLNDLEGGESSKLGLQLYFYDPQNELKNRLTVAPTLDENVMARLMTAMKQNPYASFLRSLNKVADLQSYYISINCSSSLDQRTHNCPTSDDVAAIWIDGDDQSGAAKFQRDIRVYTKSGQSWAVRESFSCYDTLQYPLMFPSGEPGWHPNIMKVAKKKKKHRVTREAESFDGECSGGFQDYTEQSLADEYDSSESGNKVTARQYYCYKLQMREEDESYQLSFGRLYQQFIVDMYIKIETMRLTYIRCNQSKFRVDFYQGIIDSLSMGVEEGKKVGRRILLPASFIGGPRDMRKRYIDAMTLVRRFGKPDVFLTMTCNSNWPEIQACVKSYEETQNRPDIVARVFRAKVEIMKKRLLVDKVFGDVASLVYVVEYQKRGLPHAHFLIILESCSKLRTPEAYDRVVSAELPCRGTDARLHAIVAHHMFHGPCGSLNPGNVCMRNGGCKSKYPKPYCSYTTHAEQCYPQYRRRNNGLTDAVRVRGHMLDNRWIVPYNPRLIREFDCHMNVEICGDIRAVKYLYKYIYKGVDKVSMKVVSNSEVEVVDEISLFQSARWISPPEAAWRIFGFTLSGMQPAVLILQIHCQNFQSVRFSDDDNLDELMSTGSSRCTMLTEFFTMNATNEVAKRLQCYYKDFPEYFVWNHSIKRWTQRKRGQVVGRLASVNPSEGERYYLRLLLLNVKAPASYEDLLFVNGNMCSTFRESANLRGLLMSDSTFENALEEASTYQLPYSLRVLFATILSYCELADPVSLYKKFFTDLSEDFRRDAVRQHLSEFDIEKRVLADLDRTLDSLGKSINDFKLGDFRVDRDAQQRITREINAEYSVSIPPEDLDAPEKLNEKQREIYDRVLRDSLSENGAVYFVDGHGGTGKTFLYRALLARLRSLGHIAIATASSGIASTLLPGGRTAHSRFKIPIEGDEECGTNLSKSSGAGHILIKAKLIIWDEAPMVNKKAIEKVDLMLRDFCETDKIFGGKVVVFGGDFRQTLPIVQGGTRAETIEATLIKSTLWEQFIIYRLTENMRAIEDRQFCEFLMRIGDGTEPESPCGRIQIPQSMLVPYTNDIDSLKSLIDEVYPDLSLFQRMPEHMCLRALLAPKNDTVHHINLSLIDRFPGDVKTYKSVDRAVSQLDEAHYTDFLNGLNPTGMPSHELRLKVNCPVVLLRNINPFIGFANGTRLICRSLDDHVIGVEIISGQFKGTHGFIPRITHKLRPGEKYVMPFTRRQFPLRLAFAMTINKSQGQTFNFVGLYLRQPVFAHGQLYVALSRARKSSDVRVLIGPPTEKECAGDLTRNEVYREVLQLSAAQHAL